MKAFKVGVGKGYSVDDQDYGTAGYVFTIRVFNIQLEMWATKRERRA
jgi:hypothetical protein